MFKFESKNFGKSIRREEERREEERR